MYRVIGLFLLLTVFLGSAIETRAEEPWRRSQVRGLDKLYAFGASDDGETIYGWDGLHWRSEDGGRTWRWSPDTPWLRLNGDRIHVHPGDSEILAFDATTFDPFLTSFTISRDGGETWTLIEDPPEEFDFILGFGHDGALYGQADTGVFRSDDLGETWTQTTVPVRSYLGQRVFAGRAATAVLALALDGFYYSTDGGRSSALRTRPSGFFGLDILDVDPFDPRRMVIAEGSRLAVSTNGGASFSVRDLGERIASVRFHPDRRSELYVTSDDSVATPRGAAVWISRNAGSSFQRWVAEDAFRDSDIVFDACNASTFYLYSPGLGNMEVTTDSGQTWTSVSPLNLGVNVLDIVSRASTCELVVRTGAGFYAIANRGAEWTAVGDPLAAGDLRQIVFDPRIEDRVYAVGPDGFLISEDHGRSWQMPNNEVQGLAFWNVVPVGDEQGLIATWVSDTAVYVSEDGGKSFERTNRLGFVGALRGNPFDRQRLFVFSSFLQTWFESIDGGLSLDREVQVVDGAQRITIDTLEVDPHREGHLFGFTVGEDGYRFFTSTDGGTTFELGASTSELAGTEPITRVGIDGTHYLVPASGAPGLGIWRSTDGGKTFDRTDFHPFERIFAMETDVRQAGTLYVAGYAPLISETRRMFRSTDHGATWQPWDQGMSYGGVVAQDPADPDVFLSFGGGYPYRRDLGETDVCATSEDILCLRQERFELEVRWQNEAGQEGRGRLVPAGTSDSGLFYFFDADNWEMLVKVLDGCGLNQRFWVLGAATTNVGYTLIVRDQVSGKERQYVNAQGVLSPAIIDTAAFDTCSDSAAAPASRMLAPGDEAVSSDGLQKVEAPVLGRSTIRHEVSTKEDCTDPDLCLQSGRFRVRVDWRNSAGESGSGTAVDFRSDDSGLFYFFGAENWELVIKVLDGCAINQRFWVLGAAVTDVGYTVSVLDTVTGIERTYSNPIGTASPAIIDTDAFEGCGL